MAVPTGITSTAHGEGSRNIMKRIAVISVMLLADYFSPHVSAAPQSHPRPFRPLPARTSALPVRGGGDVVNSAPLSALKNAVTEPITVFLRTVAGARRHLAAAAVARATSIFVMYPMDTVKTRIQMGEKALGGASAAAVTRGLYAGVEGSLIGQVPYGVLTFGSYEVYKEALLKRMPGVPPALVYAFAAILGDTTGSFWLCPSEVVKQQIQGGIHPSTAAAVRDIWAKRGFRGFYQGYGGGLARDIPFRVAQLTSYEVAKSVYLKFRRRRAGEADDDATEGERKGLGPAEAAACGAVAGTLSAAATAPLDRIKTLLMTDGAKYSNSVAKCASTILRDEGVAGLFSGVVPRVVYIAPSVALFFIVYEKVQRSFD
eukprot:CAMPEP_0194304588 /NCGR_PEP_ID=MMETSP0171-20130528/2304_1 /TAXON_ID=218684 /ORGANISM="Corethron pennatum, Strain L29A3" /LENGTH=372 /DNA_ID=CAMNT_0039055919 /DNA_START=26 /DNA_END=1144 /DNA_ORIENTATION=+